MPGRFTKPDWAVRFNPGQAVKEDLLRGDHLFVGLNCLEPGQIQKSHAHAGADKFYFVLTGRAVIRVGDEAREVEQGTLVWAPADIPHGVEEVLEQTVLLIGIAPPPGK